MRVEFPSDNSWHKLNVSVNETVMIIQNLLDYVYVVVKDEDVIPVNDEDGVMLKPLEIIKVETENFVFVKSRYDDKAIKLEVVETVNNGNIKKSYADVGIDPLGADLYAQRVVDINLSKISNGDAYIIPYVWEGVANNGFAKLYIENPAVHDKDIIIKFAIATEGKCRLKSYINYDPIVDGVTVTPVNLSISDLGISKVPHIVAKRDITRTGGDQRFNQLLPFGSGGLAQGGGLSTVYSYIETGKDVIIEIQNVSGQARDIGITVQYEER